MKEENAIIRTSPTQKRSHVIWIQVTILSILFFKQPDISNSDASNNDLHAIADTPGKRVIDSLTEKLIHITTEISPINASVKKH